MLNAGGGILKLQAAAPRRRAGPQEPPRAPCCSARVVLFRPNCKSFPCGKHSAELGAVPRVP